MIEPTQEDKHLVFTQLLGGAYVNNYDDPKFTGPGIYDPQNGYFEGYIIGDKFYPKYFTDPFTDESLTGALVKAVTPILYDKKLLLVPNRNGTYDVIALLGGEQGPGKPLTFGVPSLVERKHINTALIEIWKQDQEMKSKSNESE